MKQTQRLENVLQRVEEYVEIPPPIFRREKIQDLVEGVLPDFSKKAQEREVSFRVDTRGMEGDGQLFIDGALIRRVIAHLLDNALQSMKPGSKSASKKVVDLALFDDGNNVGLSIADRGQGIPKKRMNLIFEPFFSTHPSRVGLGLTFVRRVTEEHRGRIRVDSRVGKGTTVTLYFPKDRRRKVRREFVSPEAMEKEKT